MRERRGDWEKGGSKRLPYRPSPLSLIPLFSLTFSCSSCPFLINACYACTGQRINSEKWEEREKSRSAVLSYFIKSFFFLLSINKRPRKGFAAQAGVGRFCLPPSARSWMAIRDDKLDANIAKNIEIMYT